MAYMGKYSQCFFVFGKVNNTTVIGQRNQRNFQKHG